MHPYATSADDYDRPYFRPVKAELDRKLALKPSVLRSIKQLILLFFILS